MADKKDDTGGTPANPDDPNDDLDKEKVKGIPPAPDNPMNDPALAPTHSPNTNPDETPQGVAKSGKKK